MWLVVAILFVLVIGSVLYFVATRRRSTKTAVNGRRVATHVDLPKVSGSALQRKEYCMGGYEAPKELLDGNLPVRTVCVTLPYRAEKYDAVERMLANHGLKTERFLGVVGKHLWPDDYGEHVLSDRFKKFVTSKSSSIGHLGCTFSHTSIYRGLVDDQTSGPVLVCEDDLTVDGDFATQLKDRLTRVSRVDPEWDILLLGFSCAYNSYDKCHDNDDPEIMEGCIMPVKRFMGTWAYVLRDGAAVSAKIMESIWPQTWAIDHHLTALTQEGVLNLYGCIPMIGHHPGEWEVSSAGYKVVRPWIDYVSDTNGST